MIVKWFKKGEAFEREALKLRNDVLSGVIINLVMSEWVYLEVVRGLTKAGFPGDRIIQAYNILEEMADLGFIEAIPISRLLNKARDLEIQLKLYASDAVNIASALVNSVDMLTEDRHLLRKPVKDSMKKLGLKVLRLKDLYGDHTSM